MLVEDRIRLGVHGIGSSVEDHLIDSDAIAGFVNAGLFLRQVVESHQENGVAKGAGIDRAGEPDAYSRPQTEAVELLDQPGFLAGSVLSGAVGEREVEADAGLLQGIR